MRNLRDLLDWGTWVVILATLLLFIAALFTRGLTHDLFLEGGVFLVSVKLIMMAYRNKVAYRELHEKIDRICECLRLDGDKAR